MSRASENDVASAALPVSADDALADRMRRAFEEALLEPISIISSMATLLPEGSQADGPRQAIGSAAMQADTALRDLLDDFVADFLLEPTLHQGLPNHRRLSRLIAAG